MLKFDDFSLDQRFFFSCGHGDFGDGMRLSSDSKKQMLNAFFLHQDGY